MRRRVVRRGAAVVAALAVGMAGAVGGVGVVPAATGADPNEATPLPVPGMAVSLAQAGELALWGDNTFAQATVPAELSGVAISQVIFPGAATLALTADGRVVGWGGNLNRLERVPAEVAAAKVAQIAVGAFGRGYAGAVTRDGRVLTWGAKRAFATPLDVPAGLSGVKQLAMTSYTAAALKSDGSVVAWGQPDYGQAAVPGGLRATAITAGTDRFYALTTEGTVETWGGETTTPLPPALEEPGNVKAIASSGYHLTAVLADDSLLVIKFDGTTPVGVPTAEPVLLANGGQNEFAIVDRDRAIHYWNAEPPGSTLPGEVPAALNGRDIAQITLGSWQSEIQSYPSSLVGGVIITKMLRAELPQVTGAAQVGSVLTGVPGTFSATPDSVTSQWLVSGQPAGGGPQLTVTAAMAGKSIVYRSTATKAGQTAESSSAPVTVPPVVVPPVPPVASSTKVGKVTVAKKAAQVTVTGKVTASKSPAGKAKVTIKKGKKTIVTKSVGVSAAGAMKFTVKKFAKLVAKKLKAKGKKAKTAYRGKYQVTIAYAGNAQVKASTGSGKFTVKK